MFFSKLPSMVVSCFDAFGFILCFNNLWLVKILLHKLQKVVSLIIFLCSVEIISEWMLLSSILILFWITIALSLLFLLFCENGS